MRNDWQVKRLEDICSFNNGLWKGKNPPFVEVGVIRNTNFTKDGELDDSDIAILQVEQKQFQSRKLLKGDIIIEKSGGGPKQPVGRVVLFDKDNGDYSFSNFTSIIRILDHRYIIPKYLHRYLHYLYVNGRTEIFQRHSTGIRNLQFKEYKQIDIPIPTPQEQKLIVAILDKAFAAINRAKANVERNLENARELFQSKLNEVFEKKGEGWEEKKLNDVFEIKPNKRQARETLNETDLVTFLPMEDLGVLNKDIAGVKKRQLKEVAGSYTYFANNDVLLAKITPCFENGKLGIARNLINGIGFGSSEYIVFRTKGDIDPEYLYHFLSRDKFRDEGKNFMGGAVGHKRVSNDWIANYFIRFPISLKEQQKINQELNVFYAAIKKIQNSYQEKVKYLEELKESILQKAFDGELNTTKA